MAIPRLKDTGVWPFLWSFAIVYSSFIGNIVMVDSPRFPKSSGIDSSEKTIAILGDTSRWWPQKAKQEGDKISKMFICIIWKKRDERRNIGGVSIRNRNGAPPRKGCVVNGQMTNKASNQ